MSGDRARGQIVLYLQNVVFLFQSFLEVYILTTTYQKVFILRSYVPCRVLFHSMTSDLGSMACGGACSKAVELSSFVLLLVLMPVSVLLSYECTVLYFLIKNVHFILDSVKVD